MLATADHIEKNPDKYDQTSWCGTACCIAGHAALASGEVPDDLDATDVSCVARRFLGIEYEQGAALFQACAAEWPEPYRSDFNVINDVMMNAEAQLDNDLEALDDEFDTDTVEYRRRSAELENKFTELVIECRSKQAPIAAGLLRALASGEVTLG